MGFLGRRGVDFNFKVPKGLVGVAVVVVVVAGGGASFYPMYFMVHLGSFARKLQSVNSWSICFLQHFIKQKNLIRY